MSVRLDVVGIAVRDMAAALRFYRRLGLDIPEVFDEEPHVEITLEGFRLAWDKVEVLDEVYGGWVAEPVGHRIELAFGCDSQGEVDATYDRMVGHGYRGRKRPWDAPWGQRYAVIEDPDGNLISLYA
jgi:catechol 2,3-dioxygenase-like lactoylglutathione lyase family enzyme